MYIAKSVIICALFFYGKFLIILFIMKEVYHGMSFAGIG